MLTFRLDTTQSRLQVLYAKQGRARQFRSQAERDAFLSDEIKSLESFQQQQQKTISERKKEVEGAKAHLEEVSARSEEQQQGEEGQRETLKQMSEEQTKLKIDLDTMKEKRKWVAFASLLLELTRQGALARRRQAVAVGLKCQERVGQRAKIAAGDDGQGHQQRSSCRAQCRSPPRP